VQAASGCDGSREKEYIVNELQRNGSKMKKMTCSNCKTKYVSIWKISNDEKKRICDFVDGIE
jgi:hypothetical protein